MLEYHIQKQNALYVAIVTYSVCDTKIICARKTIAECRAYCKEHAARQNKKACIIY